MVAHNCFIRIPFVENCHDTRKQTEQNWQAIYDELQHIYYPYLIQNIEISEKTPSVCEHVVFWKQWSSMTIVNYTTQFQTSKDTTKPLILQCAVPFLMPEYSHQPLNSTLLPKLFQNFNKIQPVEWIYSMSKKILRAAVAGKYHTFEYKYSTCRPFSKFKRTVKRKLLKMPV